MPRSAASIQTEIDAIDAAILKAADAQSYSIAGRSVSRQNLDSLTKRRDALQQQLDRVTGQAPMFARGVVRGLR